MSKIIIKYPDDIHPMIALTCVEQVIRDGRISESRGQEKYCHATVFDSAQGKVVVFARDREYESAPDSFVIERDNRNGGVYTGPKQA